LQGLRHPLDVAGQIDDLVVIAAVGIGVRFDELLLFGDGVQGSQPLLESAIPDITRQNEEDAGDNRHCHNPIG